MSFACWKINFKQSPLNQKSKKLTYKVGLFFPKKAHLQTPADLFDWTKIRLDHSHNFHSHRQQKNPKQTPATLSDASF